MMTNNREDEHGISSRFKAFKNKLSGAFRKDKRASDTDTIEIASPSSTITANDRHKLTILTNNHNNNGRRKKSNGRPDIPRQNTGVSSNSLVSTVSYPGSVVDELFEPYSRYVKPSPSNDIEAAVAPAGAANNAAESRSSFFGPWISKISSRASTYHRTSFEDNNNSLNPPITKSMTATTMPEDEYIDTGALIYPAKSSATDLAYHDDDESDESEDEEVKTNPGYRQWKRIRREWRRGAKNIDHKESMLKNIPEDMYPKIYKHMVMQSRPLKQPMNLADAMKVIKAGWVEDGEWGAAEAASRRERERLEKEKQEQEAKAEKERLQSPLSVQSQPQPPIAPSVKSQDMNLLISSSHNSVDSNSTSAVMAPTSHSAPNNNNNNIPRSTSSGPALNGDTQPPAPKIVLREATPEITLTTNH